MSDLGPDDLYISSWARSNINISDLVTWVIEKNFQVLFNDNFRIPKSEIQMDLWNEDPIMLFKIQPEREYMLEGKIYDVDTIKNIILKNKIDPYTRKLIPIKYIKDFEIYYNSS